jgi:hypothetical protein
MEPKYLYRPGMWEYILTFRFITEFHRQKQTFLIQCSGKIDMLVWDICWCKKSTTEFCYKVKNENQGDAAKDRK